ncbi:MAG: DNA-formamidopyrimidine glycosylase family protein [Ilumatobacteraceae bacterium]
MPEGDTIHRAAAALRSALVDQKMLFFEAPRLVGLTPRAGRTIERVESHGKHLEIEWDDGIILHTHMRMSGSWHLYRKGQSWLRNHRDVRALIEVDGWVAVCFNAPLVETYRHPDASRHPGRRALGPDLCRADADLRRCVDGLLAYDDPHATIAEVLLDRRVFCGVGNVYRCEVLWVAELSPFASVGELPEADAVRLVNLAAQLLRANLRHAQRVTIPGVRGGLAVYGRSGQPCQRCSSTVLSRRTGEFARTLYWCPGCQVRLAPRRPPAPPEPVLTTI